MELLGDSLEFLMVHCGGLSYSDISEVALGMIDGLERMHSLGICHQDIKPVRYSPLSFDAVDLKMKRGCKHLSLQTQHCWKANGIGPDITL